MTSLVTGVAGFIGSTLAEALVNNGEDVVGVDSFSTYYDPSLKRSNLTRLLRSDRFRLVEADLCSVDLDLLLTGVDTVYHQAGQPGVRKSWGSDFTIYTEANVVATQRLLEAAKAVTTLSRFVYASSSSVYGDAERYPTVETDLPRPISPYGVTKLAAEHLCSLYATEFDVPTVSLRYFTVYGPRQRPDMAFTRFIRAALQEDSISVFGDGTQIREFTYVEDIVAANILASSRAIAPGTVVNLSGGSSVTVNHVLDLIGSAIGSPVKVQYKERSRGDVYRTGGSTNKAADILGWHPTVDVEEGIVHQIGWMRSLMAGTHEQ